MRNIPLQPPQPTHPRPRLRPRREREKAKRRQRTKEDSLHTTGRNIIKPRRQHSCRHHRDKPINPSAHPHTHTQAHTEDHTPSNPKSQSLHPSIHPGATTSKFGIVVHGIALRKDLGNVRRWMEAASKDIGKITGIRWLRNKGILNEEGKKTSSVVVYLEDMKEVERVRLGGRWLRSCQYEWDRGRK
ncbi:hypothetical protein BDZ91DRAFT_829588 [Kalaharituber pfeilii]|nr:hypothetical protein BDZ91DRAFT_829588 [Kalaharituber pfeilii]